MNCAHRGGGLPSPVTGWIYNYSIKNYWRVSAFYELDDLCQDGLLCAVRCRNRYGDIPDQHLMSLVKTAFSRYVIDLTRHRMVAGNTIYIADLGTNEVVVREKHSIPELPLGELARCIEELPDYLYHMLRCLLTNVQIRTSHRDERDLRAFLL